MAGVVGRSGFRVGRVLGRSTAVLFRSIVPFTLLSLILHAPLIILAFAGPPMGEASGFHLVQRLGWPLLGWMTTAALIHGVFQRLLGRPAGIGACLRICLARFFPVVGVSLVVVVLTVVWVVPAAMFAVSGLGAVAVLLVLIVLIPAATVWCMFWVAVPVVVVERRGVLASLRRSAQLTRGEKLPILAVVLLIELLREGAAWILEPFAGETGMMALVTLPTEILIGALGAIAVAIAYHDLRFAKEGARVEDLLRVFA